MRFDINLFEQLNEEYRDKPIHNLSMVTRHRHLVAPSTTERRETSREDRIRYACDEHLKPIVKDIDLKDRVVLELGCGHGYLTAGLIDHAGVERAIGIDVVRFPSWADHDDPRLSLIVGDLSTEQILPPASIDVVISQVVFEHVERPVQMLAAVYELLKGGGTAWLRMNVFTARNASHCYSEVFFPWPHLLFEDEVVTEFYRRHHGQANRRFSWVNRMTVASYLHTSREIGFDITTVRRRVEPIDVPFYLRFQEQLGRYQALDLETDFLTMILVKGKGLAEQTASAIATVSYLGRQRDLDLRIEQHRAALPEPAPVSASTGNAGNSGPSAPQARTSAMTFDIDLFERLNEEYREKPIHNSSTLSQRRRMLTPTAENRAATTRDERVRFAGDFQLKAILNDVDVAGKVALEVGCGHGYLTAALVECAGAARAIGVDTTPGKHWQEHDDPRLTLLAGDMSAESLVAPESVDVVVSQVVFEHVTRPLQMLSAVYDAMKVGATAWLRMNVFSARNASHLYNEVFFPWPHLLFEDSVVKEFYPRHHNGSESRFAWVNRMTVANYLHACREIGFDVLAARRTTSPIDIPFYLRFEDKLGRYQALDLETNFLILILGKGMNAAEQTAKAIADVNYLARQRELDQRIEQYQAAKRQTAAV